MSIWKFYGGTGLGLWDKMARESPHSPKSSLGNGNRPLARYISGPTSIWVTLHKIRSIFYLKTKHPYLTSNPRLHPICGQKSDLFSELSSLAERRLKRKFLYYPGEKKRGWPSPECFSSRSIS